MEVEIRYGLRSSLLCTCSQSKRRKIKQNQPLSTLIHSCWFKNQQPALAQYWIGRVAQYSIGADKQRRKSYLSATIKMKTLV